MIRTFGLAATVIMATTAPAVAQTTQPPATTAASQPLTADEVKVIKHRLEVIEHDIAQEYERYMNNRGAETSGTRPPQMERLVEERGYARRPLSRNVRPVTPYIEELLRERTTLEAKLASSRTR